MHLDHNWDEISKSLFLDAARKPLYRSCMSSFIRELCKVAAARKPVFDGKMGVLGSAPISLFTGHVTSFL